MDKTRDSPLEPERRSGSNAAVSTGQDRSTQDGRLNPVMRKLREKDSTTARDRDEITFRAFFFFFLPLTLYLRDLVP